MNKFRVYCWGLAEHGALGLKKTDSSRRKPMKYTHRPVRHYFGEENRVVAVGCGFGFTAFGVQSSDRYKVYGCGINSDSQCGYHDPRKGHPLGVLLAPAPIDLGLKRTDTRVVSLAAGRAHLAVATDNEGVFTLGSNCYGQCGRRIIDDEKYTAGRYVHNIAEIESEKIASVICGQDHTLFLSRSGNVYSCGWGADGQTGLDVACNVSAPTKVRGEIEGETIVKLAARSDCVLALNDNGEVFGWGNNEYVQLDAETTEQQVNCPRSLNRLLRGIGKITDIASGGSVCMVLNEAGDVFTWGFGILGVGPTAEQSKVPVRIPSTLFGCNEFQPDTRVVSIACGLSHYAAINNHHNLYTWGRNRYGCLGIGHIRDQFFPYKVAFGAEAVSASCGVDHTMVLAKPYS